MLNTPFGALSYLSNAFKSVPEASRHLRSSSGSLAQFRRLEMYLFVKDQAAALSDSCFQVRDINTLTYLLTPTAKNYNSSSGCLANKTEITSCPQRDKLQDLQSLNNAVLIMYKMYKNSCLPDMVWSLWRQSLTRGLLMRCFQLILLVMVVTYNQSNNKNPTHNKTMEFPCNLKK